MGTRLFDSYNKIGKPVINYNKDNICDYTQMQKIGRIIQFTIANGRFPKPKYIKDNSIFNVVEKSFKNYVKNRVKRIVKVNPIDLDELQIIAELKTHHPELISDDRLLNRHISDTTAYMIRNTSDKAIYIQILDESLSLESESRVDLIIEPWDIAIITSLEFALIVLCSGSNKIGNAGVKMTVPQSVLDEIIGKTSLMNVGNFITIDRENCDNTIITLYVD